jgi:hypothetical protein
VESGTVGQARLPSLFQCLRLHPLRGGGVGGRVSDPVTLGNGRWNFHMSTWSSERFDFFDSWCRSPMSPGGYSKRALMWRPADLMAQIGLLIVDVQTLLLRAR